LPIFGVSSPLVTVRARGPKKWEIVAYAGLDPVTGKERRVSRIFYGSKTQARDRERELVLEQRGDQAPADITFAELVTRWMAVARHEASTRGNVEGRLKNHVTPRLGKLQVARIRTVDLDRLYVDLEQGSDGKKPLAPATIARIHTDIRACLGQAVTWDWIATNPAKRARPPEIPSRDPEAPDPEDVLTLLAVARAKDPELYAYLRLAANTGLRPGSTCALRVSDFNPRAWTVRHHRAIGQAKGGGYLKSTKSGGRHTITLGPITVAVLRWHLWRMRVRARSLDTDLARDAFIFSLAADGATPWQPNYVSKRYRRLADTANVGDELRTLRHFHATRLLAAGVDPTTLSHRMTHSRTSTTLDKYGAPVPQSDRYAAGIMDGQLGRQRMTPM
jgi:integrase